MLAIVFLISAPLVLSSSKPIFIPPSSLVSSTLPPLFTSLPRPPPPHLPSPKAVNPTSKKPRTWAVTVSYDGTAFPGGWEANPSLSEPTVQGELQSRLCMNLNRPKMTVSTAGRTDAYVSAKSSLCSFKSHNPPDIIALSDGRIAVHDIFEVDASFHPSFSSTARTYLYVLPLVEAQPSLAKFVDESLQRVKGTHDFFSLAYGKVKTATTVCTLSSLRCVGYDPDGNPSSGPDIVPGFGECWAKTSGENCLAFLVTGDRFLRRMMRRLVAEAVECGLTQDVDGIMRVLERGKRRGEICASPEGLCLWTTSVEQQQESTAAKLNQEKYETKSEGSSFIIHSQSIHPSTLKKALEKLKIHSHDVTTQCMEREDTPHIHIYAKRANPDKALELALAIEECSDPKPILVTMGPEENLQSARLQHIEHYELASPIRHSSRFQPASVHATSTHLDFAVIDGRDDFSQVIELDGLIDQKLLGDLNALVNNENVWVRGAYQDTPDQVSESLGYDPELLLDFISDPPPPIMDLLERVSAYLAHVNSPDGIISTLLPHAVYGDEIPPIGFNAPVQCDDPSSFQFHIDADPSLAPPSAFTDCYGRYPNRTPGKPRFISALAYINKEWDSKFGAGTEFLDTPKNETFTTYPAPGRVVLLDSDLVHRVTRPEGTDEPRYSLACKMVIHPTGPRAVQLIC